MHLPPALLLTTPMQPPNLPVRGLVVRTVVTARGLHFRFPRQ